MHKIGYVFVDLKKLRLKKVRICRALFIINLHTSKFKYIDIINMLVIRLFRLQCEYIDKKQGDERE